MKKLMFGLAIAAVGTAFAVESSNIVGYNNNGVEKFMFVGTPFEQVNGTDTMNLSDLNVNCPDDEEQETGWIALSDAVVQLDADGNFVRKLVYIPQWLATVISEDVPCAKGWYDQADTDEGDYSTPYNTVSIPFGTSVQVAVDGNGANVLFSGGVKKTPTISPVAGFMSLANCACKTLKLSELKVNCPDDEEQETGWIALSDAVVQLDDDGNFVRKLVYIPQWLATVISEDIPCAKGWYDQADTDEGDYTKPYGETVTWNAGEGFQVAVDGNGVLVQIDSALSDAE